MAGEENRNIEKDSASRFDSEEKIEKTSGYVRSKQERIDSVVSQIAAGIRVLVRSATDKITMSASSSFSLGEGETLESVKFGACPGLATVPGELIRADIYENNIATSPLPIRDLLRLEIEPFIIGVGWVRVDYTPEGIVIFRSNLGEVKSRHNNLTDTGAFSPTEL